MNIYDFSVLNTKGESIQFDKYKGKVLLIFNSASRCGYTYQYEAIESLYAKYREEGFEVLDFPCNQFLNQAPGSNEELANFCKMKFGTTFTTFGKIDVNGKKTHDLYKFLKKEKPFDYPEKKTKLLPKLFKKEGSIKWNFTKFLIDRNGNVVERFGPGFEPVELEKFIEALL
jgi:glutathione peroxidase